MKFGKIIDKLKLGKSSDKRINVREKNVKIWVKLRKTRKDTSTMRLGQNE